jgi:hypothetical protein
VFRLFRFWDTYPPHGDLLRVLAMSWGWKPPKPPEEPEKNVSFKDALKATGDAFKAPSRFFKRT